MTSSEFSAPRLDTASKLLYASGMLGYTAMLRMVSGWLQKHMVPPDVDLQIVPILVFGGVMAFGRSYVDAVTDPVIGFWSDHARTRWGRRKPFILAGAIPTVICLLGLFFMTPDQSSGGVVTNSILYFIFINGYFIACTLMAMPYLAMLPEIAPHPVDRKQVATLLAVAVIIGVGLGQVIPGLMDLRDAAILMAGIGTVTFVCVVFVFREPEWARVGHDDTLGDESGNESATTPGDTPGTDGAIISGESSGDATGKPTSDHREFDVTDAPPTIPGETPAKPVPGPYAHRQTDEPDAFGLPAHAEPIGLKAGFAMLAHSMWFAIVLVVRTVFVTLRMVLSFLAVELQRRDRYRHGHENGEPIGSAWSLTIGGKPVRFFPRNVPEPLQPLGKSLGVIMRFKPFLGFSGGFIALHAAFVLLTSAIMFVPQALLGYNDADAYANLLTREASADAATDLSANSRTLPRLSPEIVAGQMALLRARNTGERIEGQQLGDLLIGAGHLTAEGNGDLLKYLDLRANEKTTEFLMVTIGSTFFFGIPLVYWMLGTIGKKWTGMVSLLVFTIAPLWLPFVGFSWVPIHGDWLVYAMGVAVGISFAGIFILDNLLLADVIDMNTRATGERRESLFFGIYGLSMKIGIGAAFAISSVLFAHFGFSYGASWGVRLSGPASSVVVFIGMLMFWRLYPSTEPEPLGVRQLTGFRRRKPDATAEAGA